MPGKWKYTESISLALIFLTLQSTSKSSLYYRYGIWRLHNRLADWRKAICGTALYVTSKLFAIVVVQIRLDQNEWRREGNFFSSLPDSTPKMPSGTPTLIDRMLSRAFATKQTPIRVLWSSHYPVWLSLDFVFFFEKPRCYPIASSPQNSLVKSL